MTKSVRKKKKESELETKYQREQNAECRFKK